MLKIRHIAKPRTFVGNVMRPYIIISAFIFLTSLKVTAQTYNANLPTDTINLRDLSFKKVLAYQVGNATILADYNDFMKSFKPFWNKFKKGVRSLDRGKVKAIEENPWYVKRFKFLDSTYKRLTEQIKTQDTVFISDISFMMAEIGTSYDFVGKIENGQCLVLNKKNEIQPFILRQKYSYQRGPLDGWGGRLYFILGQEKPFIRGTDWVS